jgi:biopolymer transport protein ExbB/TolQ
MLSILSLISAYAQEAANAPGTVQIIQTTSLEGNLMGILQKIQQGAPYTYFVLVIWAAGIAICLERFIKLRSLDVDGPSFWNEIQRFLLSNDYEGAIRVCSATTAGLPRILKAGLQRAKREDVSSVTKAIEATTFEVTPKIDVRMNFLAVIASLSTLMGLIGTIQGLIHAFESMSSADPNQKTQLMALGFAEAMNTTYFGLISAITIMILHAFLAAKAEKIKGELDEFSHKLLDLMNLKKEQKNA